MLRTVSLLLCTAALMSAETRLGRPLTLTAPVQVDQLLTTPEASVNRKVQVKGKVTEVCQMAGCWMQLNGTGKNSIRIKVNDGDIVFPKEAIGKTAIAEGVLKKFQLTREQAIAQARHEAEERGIKFNPASIKSGTTYYQISGEGALILE